MHNPYFPDCDADVQYINQTVELTGDIASKNKVIVNSGKKLTLTNCNWQFATGGSIELRGNARLILDNTTLTSCGNGKWDGIVIDYDNNSLGAIIEVLNQSTISNAVTGIYVNSQDGNGSLSLNTITCKDATFENNDIGVKIKDNLNSFSYNSYVNCDFDGNQTAGIELINNWAAVVDNCTFSDGAIGVNAIDSWLLVYKGTEFEGMHQGLLIEGTHPLSSVIKIGDMNTASNSFTNNNYGIYCTGVVGADAMQISNNNFNNDVNTSFYGSNFYLVNNNSYTGGKYGLSAATSGDEFNHIQCNVFNHTCPK